MGADQSSIAALIHAAAAMNRWCCKPVSFSGRIEAGLDGMVLIAANLTNNKSTQQYLN
jgi:hypothetical protein